MGNRKEPIETEGSGIPNHHALHNRQSSTLQLLRRLAVRRLALRWRHIHADCITVEERVYGMNPDKNLRRSGPITTEELKDWLYVAGYHVERGIRTFADFSRQMVLDIGDEVKP